MPKSKQPAKTDERSRSKSIAKTEKAEPANHPAPAKTAKKTTALLAKSKEAPVIIEASRSTRSKKLIEDKNKPKSKSVDQLALESESEDAELNELLYKSGDFVAYVDKDDAENAKLQISIGKVLQDSPAESHQVTIQQYVATNSKDKVPLKFKLVDEEKVILKDYQIVSQVELAKNSGTDESINFTKPTITNVQKILENLFDVIREKVNEEIDAEAELSEVSSESKESEEEVKKGSKKTQPKTSKIVRAKRQVPQTQTTTAGASAGLKTNIRSASRNAAKKIKEVAEQSDEDIEGHNEDSENEEDEGEKPKGKKTAIGAKRTNPFNASSQAATRKVKKLVDGSEVLIETKVVKQKKPAKKPVVFKAGTWNPDTVLLGQNDELQRYGTSDSPIYDCCLRCNNRNVIRAIETNNIRLFRSVVYDKKNIPCLNDAWSVDSQHLEPMKLIVQTQNKQMLEVLYKIPVSNAADQNVRRTKLQEFYVNDRVAAKAYLLNRINTGKVNYKAYGTAVRSVEMTRGNRQGNQAFFMNQMNPQVPSINEIKHLTIDMFKEYQLLNGMPTEDYIYRFQEFARLGKRDFLIWLMEPIMKQENYGFNELHLDVLKLDKLTKKYHTASITKKAQSVGQITPLHLACLNPSKEVLQTLLEQNNDINVMDNQNYKPIHYAAACQDPSIMKLLLEKGANLFDFTTQKVTPLHIAAQNGNSAVIQVILENNPLLYKFRDRQNKTGMTYACELGEIEPIKAFLDYSGGKVKVNTGQGVARMTPLMYAASMGKYELAEFLLERKARVLSKDKYKRTPLIMAVRNAHTRLASLLLQRGSEWNHCDSSNNTPLHYAAASGSIECIDLLIKHGADVNAQNSWKVTPITIAMLNNHIGTVKRLLQEESVDVNGKDDKGRTLLLMTMIDLSEPSCVNFAKYLLDKGADPNIGDLDGNTPLHTLAAYKIIINSQHQWQKRVQEEEKKSLMAMIDLLVSRGSNLSLLNDEKKNAFSIALDCDNIDVLHKFSESIKVSENPELLHKFKAKIFDDRYKKIFIELLNKEQNLSPETMNTLNSQGFSPFLAYVDQYIDGLKSFDFSTKIRNALQWNAYKHQQNYSRYKVTNEDLFVASFQQDSDYINQRSRDIQYVPEDKLQSLIKEHIKQLITLPFIEFLKLIISKGADPLRKVDKTEFYRELDEHKKTLSLVSDAREGIAAVQNLGPNEEMQIDTNQQRQIKVKTRAEILAEQRVDQKKGKKLKKEISKDQNKRVHKQLKEFYAKKGYLAVFQKVNGKLVEIEYNKEYGLQNALHLTMRHCSKTFFDFLVNNLRIPVDEVDFQGRNPFMLAVLSDPNKYHMTESMQKLLDMNVRFDLSDSKGRTPFLIYYENRNKVLANKMLTQGANIKQMDEGGLFALKYALIRRENEEITRLVSLGADINQIDQKGRNLLHHAVNMSSATADATFETEQLLIDLGVNINLRDNKMRVPLHYAFVKISDWFSSQQIDPIETVSSLCGQKDLDIEVPDKWQKTPLHYAAQRGASICTLYILNRGSNLEAKDIYGNTALGISSLRKHFNYSIILIQKSANVKVQVWDEFPKRIAKQWKDQEKAEKMQSRQINGENVDMESDEDEEVENAKTGRDLFKQKVKKTNVFFGNAYGSEDDDYDQEDSSSEEDVNAHERQVFNQQNAFGMNVYGSRGALPAKVALRSQYAQSSVPKKMEDEEVEKEKAPNSCFRLAIQNQQQGLAYLILDSGYDYMLAMQDALDEKKFNLVLTLLGKTADDRIVRQKNSKQQNLMHILSQNANGGQFHILKRIYDALKKRGVNCLERDVLGSNALHYAIGSNCFDLCQILISEGIGINDINNDGHSPLSLYMKGQDGASRTLRSAQFGAQKEAFESKSLFLLLVKNGADVNVRYPEESFPEDKNYKCTLMINIIRHSAISMEYMRPNLQCLIEFGAKFDVVDSNKRDVLMYAIMHNDTELIKFIVNNKDQGLIQNHLDLEGKNAIHYVVNPAKYGSFENVQLLKDLLDQRLGYNAAQKDNHGKTPLEYALLQESGVMAQVLQQKLGLTSKKNQRDMISYIPESEWPAQTYNYNEDSQKLLDEAEQRKAQEIREEQKESYVPLDQVLHGDKQYKVYYDGEDRRPYDAYLQKVDLKNGLYGDYVFYKMQLLHDTNRDLYIVLTRWGRIGEEGMHQRSPFNQVEEAKKEFQTIFKSKTSNEWETALTSFVKQNKKYSLVHVHYSNVKHQDYLAPFDYENCAKTQMDKHQRLLIEEIANVTMYQRAIQTIGVDKDQLPISNLKKETLEKAKVILQQIKLLITELDQERAKYNQANYEKVQELRVRISDDSSKYFELIPLAEHKDQITRPIDNLHNLSTQYQKLELLTSVEFSSKVLLGALYRQLTVNPVDYVSDCIQTNIRVMLKEEPEYQLISQYIENTCSQSLQKFKSFNLFKLERKGEGERFESYRNLKNRRLLFHGSAMTNMLGIMAQGLRIAPPEAPTTGYMFGKGVYFADTFDKSAAYTSGHQSRLMLMCEVALGEMMELYQSHYVENLPTRFNSVKGCGAKGPDFDKKTLITPNGFQVPVGKQISYESPTVDRVKQSHQIAGIPAAQQINMFGGGFGGGFGGFGGGFGGFGAQRGGYGINLNVFNWHLQHNEYIVYNVNQIKVRYMIQFQM